MPCYVDAGHCRPTPNLSYKPRNHSIAVYLINARSLVNKMDLLRCYLCDFWPAIVCTPESWAHSDQPDSFFFVKGYVFYRCDRSEGTGGGVIIYVSNSLSSIFLSNFDDGKAGVVTCLVSSYCMLVKASVFHVFTSLQVTIWITAWPLSTSSEPRVGL